MGGLVAIFDPSGNNLRAQNGAKPDMGGRAKRDKGGGAKRKGASAAAAAAAAPTPAPLANHDRVSSNYRGVSWHKRSGKWEAKITHEKRRNYLGAFQDEVEAARAYDKRARQLYGAAAQLNFPRAGEKKGAVLHRVDDALRARASVTNAEVEKRKRQNKAASMYRGVSWHKQRCKWVAHISHENFTQNLGHFVEEADAARAYDAAGTWRS